MPRLPRCRRQSLCYHLYNRGLDRRTLFHDAADFERFGRTVGRYKTACPGVRLYHWAWMGNHYHMLAESPPTFLRSFVAGVQQSYAQYYRRRYGTCGPVWQGRFHSRPVERDLCLTRCGRYVERNAVRAGLAAVAWEYRWSSAAFYALGEGACGGDGGGLTDLDPRFDSATGPSERERADYRAMLLDTADETWMAEHGRGLVIGSAAFASRLTLQDGRVGVRPGRPSGAAHAAGPGDIQGGGREPRPREQSFDISNCLDGG
jgi:putative transposase